MPTEPPFLPPAPDVRLPDGFAVRLAPGTSRSADGAALLGGSPLRMLRLSPRAGALLSGDRLVVRDATTAALAGRLLDAGVARPEPEPVAPGTELTVVVPVRDRPAGVDRLLSALRADPATSGVRILVVDDGSADPAALARAVAAHGGELLRHDVSRGPAAARNTGLRAATTPAVAFLDSDCVPVTGWTGALLGHLADPRLAVVAPRIAALPGEPGRSGGWAAAYEAAASALDMGARPAAVRPLSAVSYVPSAALLARRAALGAGFDERMRVAEDVDLVWRLVGAGWRVRYEPAAEVAHEHPATTRSWLARRAFYGTGAARLAARHGSAVAPLVVSPWSVAAWALALLGGRRGRLAAAGVLGVASVRLAARLRRAGERPPLALAGSLVLRGTGSAGRALARAATRHYWPLSVLLAVVSRRARRLLVAVAVADAVGGWWPVRDRVSLPGFAAARRLEDLGYGAGLWAGAVRARSLRALLPAAPPAVAGRPAARAAVRHRSAVRCRESLVQSPPSSHDGRDRGHPSRSAACRRQ